MIEKKIDFIIIHFFLPRHLDPWMNNACMQIRYEVLEVRITDLIAQSFQM